MTRRRFFAPENAFDLIAAKVVLTADEARHLRDVLRLRIGDEAYVFNGLGKEFRCTISETTRHDAALNIQEEVKPASPESPVNITLALALLKGEKFDLVVQKATELGVGSVIPVATRYSDIQLRGEADAQKRVARWQRIALEAAKQCGRAVVPLIKMPVSYGSLASATSSSLRLLFSEREGKPLIKATETRPRPRRIEALVGSEGGWSDEELVEAKNAGWEVVTLGGRTLRAETAAIVVTTLLQHDFGDLK